MSQEQLHQRIEEALKAITTFAMQADEILEELSKENKAKFKAIFPNDGPFEVSGNRFLPYMEELDKDFKALPNLEDESFESALNHLVKKMEAIQNVLQGFHQLRDYQEEDQQGSSETKH